MARRRFGSAFFSLRFSNSDRTKYKAGVKRKRRRATAPFCRVLRIDADETRGVMHGERFLLSSARGFNDAPWSAVTPPTPISWWLSNLRSPGTGPGGDGGCQTRVPPAQGRVGTESKVLHACRKLTLVISTGPDVQVLDHDVPWLRDHVAFVGQHSLFPAGWYNACRRTRTFPRRVP